jgi:hypothetical protein
MSLPFDDFIFNVECVQLACEEEGKQMEELKKESRSNSPQISFDDWEEQVRVANAKGKKESKYGIKSK